MIDFKRFFITLITILSANIVFADSYIMIADGPITEIKCEDNCIVNVHALTTLTNEKKSVIVTALKDGSTQFTIKVKNRCHCYKVNVTNGIMQICGDNTVKILTIDLPPEALPTEATPAEGCTK
ncbi:MAG: hypothetical protein NC200_00550 [Candidatus Gastranaerophilales bacterium]|nr:hypothetical protein [Candidatus Gastranaerophilales bacterium]